MEKSRRLSVDSGVSVGGLSAAKIEKLSFKQTYSKVVDLESKEATQCVICITGIGLTYHRIILILFQISSPVLL